MTSFEYESYLSLVRRLRSRLRPSRKEIEHSLINLPSELKNLRLWKSLPFDFLKDILKWTVDSPKINLIEIFFTSFCRKGSLLRKLEKTVFTRNCFLEQLLEKCSNRKNQQDRKKLETQRMSIWILKEMVHVWLLKWPKMTKYDFYIKMPQYEIFSFKI